MDFYSNWHHQSALLQWWLTSTNCDTTIGTMNILSASSNGWHHQLTLRSSGWWQWQTLFWVALFCLWFKAKLCWPCFFSPWNLVLSYFPSYPQFSIEKDITSRYQNWLFIFSNGTTLIWCIRTLSEEHSQAIIQYFSITTTFNCHALIFISTISILKVVPRFWSRRNASDSFLS